MGHEENCNALKELEVTKLYVQNVCASSIVK